MKTKIAKIPGFQDYLAFSDGRVYSTITFQFIKPCTNSSGYQYINIKSDTGVFQMIRVHKAILTSFVPKPDSHQCDHIDSNKQNNALENLRWVTPSQNVRASKSAKLAPSDIIEIFHEYIDGMSTYKIAKKYQVSRPLISYIINEKIWSDVKLTKQTREGIMEIKILSVKKHKTGRKFAPEDIHNIFTHYIYNQLSINQISKLYDSTTSTIRNILASKTYADISIEDDDRLRAKLRMEAFKDIFGRK